MPVIPRPPRTIPPVIPGPPVAGGTGNPVFLIPIIWIPDSADGSGMTMTNATRLIPATTLPQQACHSRDGRFGRNLESSPTHDYLDSRVRGNDRKECSPAMTVPTAPPSFPGHPSQVEPGMPPARARPGNPVPRIIWIPAIYCPMQPVIPGPDASAGTGNPVLH